MEEKKFVQFKKEELGVKEYIKKDLGKGKISSVSVEYTPVGEKIIVATSRPGMVIGRRGEKIDELTRYLKKKFKLDNPHIDILEITEPKLDAQLVADEIAVGLERQGSLRFKVISYRALQDIMNAGALGVELVLSGRLPSERAKTWRFAQGYLKKTGDPAKVVDKAKAQAITVSGVVGVKVSILPPKAHIHDKIVINSELTEGIKKRLEEGLATEEEPVKKKKTVKKKAGGKK